MQTELQAIAQRRGYRDAESLLSNPAGEWKSPVALVEVAQSSLDDLLKLKRALSRMIARQDDPSISASDLEQMGLDDYAREFGHTISARHLRNLFNRTMDRDRGAMDFERLEIYLSERPALKNPSKPVVKLAVEVDFQALKDTIASFGNPVDPSPDEKQLLWVNIMEVYQDRMNAGKEPKKLKYSLIEFLIRNAPFLVSADCSNVKNSMRVNFQNKLARWASSGGDITALSDGRMASSGWHRAPELSQEDRDRLASHAVLSCGGRVAQAWREMMNRREFSPEIMSYYLSNPGRKSYVPHRIADAVKHEVKSMLDIHHGPRQAKLNGPHISRDWSSVHSLEWMQADDVTFPVYYRARDGKGGWEYMRGQTLVMVDLRSTRILGFVLLSQRNYTARAIRTLITKVCNEYGLPTKGFYFENGIWKASKMITGSKASGLPGNGSALSDGEVELGLREFGIQFRHAQLPRAKPVERVLGAAQNLMEGWPGYVGRNEMVEKFERIQKLKLDAERGDMAAISQFMDEDEYAKSLQGLFAAYNSTPQGGKMTEGRSPDETFQACLNPVDPPVKFSAECSYLLAHHKRPVRVTGKGIKMGEDYYYGKAISGMVGHTLLAWINPEQPEFITITDMNRKNPQIVSRALNVPAMNAPDEVLAAAHRQISDFTGETKARYKVLKAIRPITFRPMFADRAAVDLGAKITAQREAAETRQKEQATVARTVQNRAHKIGLPTAIIDKGRNGDEGTRMMLEALRDEENKNQSFTPENE